MADRKYFICKRFFTDAYRTFEASHDANTWQEKYTFAVCSRKSYELDRNFRDYLTKAPTYPDIDFKMAKLGDDYAAAVQKSAHLLCCVRGILFEK